MMVLREEHDELMRQVERKQDEIAHEVALQFQKAVVEDAIPFKEIEEELLALSLRPDRVGFPMADRGRRQYG